MTRAQRLWRWQALVVLIALCIFWSTAHAHKASDAYLRVTGAAANTPVRVQLSMALKDLDAAVETLDADNDRQIVWGEVRSALPDLVRWVDSGLVMHCDQRTVAAGWAFESLERRGDGVYVRLGRQFECEAPQSLTLDYRLMKGIDPTHRLLVSASLADGDVAAVTAPDRQGEVTLRAGASTGASSGLGTLIGFFPQGVYHIVTGYDHLAFLLVLLLPVRLRADPQRPGAALRPGLVGLLVTVTGFTVGHSVTLVAAVMGLIPSPGWVEPAIALSIAVAALLNLYPQRWVHAGWLALGFGLIHGLGFSNIMREADISAPLLPWALAGFNLGVEAGQLAGVALWCAAHVLLVNWRRYDRVVVRGGSWALLLLASGWTVQRLWPVPA